ncbi:MAG: MEDS domain-containing protein [Acidobacteriota bacterium]
MVQGNVASAVEELKPRDHLCLIYDTPEDQAALAASFLRAGLEKRERCLYVSDDGLVETVLAAMKRMGVEVGAARAVGALEIVTKREAYLRDGYFTPQRMIDFLRESTISAQRSGYQALRLAAEMTWALGDESGVERLVEYEALLNHFFREHACLAACQYDRKRFAAETVRAVIHTHPLVTIGQTVARNFFFIPPDEYLAHPEERINLEIDRMLRQMVALEQAQEALVRTEKLAVAGRMAASIAHEINNPLAGLTNLLYLAEGASSLQSAREFVQRAQSQAARLSAVTHRTLGFFRDSGKPQPVALRELVMETSEVLAHKRKLKVTHIQYEADSDVKVLANAGELRQILVNLIDNAIDASDPGGRIWVTAEKEGAFARVQVGDAGSGIPPEHLASIFEPFFSTKKNHGTGLGLWVVQDLVARQGGSIQVASHTSGSNRGTVFTLMLPAGS